MSEGIYQKVSNDVPDRRVGGKEATSDLLGARGVASVPEDN